MARVVQRRSTPPYLLIVFVFLFLVATVVAVMMYLDRDKLGQQVVSMKSTNEQIFRSQEELTRAMADKTAAGAKGDSLIKFLQDEVSVLTELLDMKTNSIPNDAPVRMALRARYPQLAKYQADLARGLFKFVEDKNLAMNTQKAQIDSLTDDLKAAKESRDNADKALQAVNAQLDAHKEEIEKKNAEIAKLVDTIKSSNDTSWAELLKKNAEELAQMAKDNENAKKEMAKLATAKGKIDAEMARLLAEIAAVKPKMDVSRMAKQPDATILRVDDGTTVYVDLGKNEKVQPGMTFSVYPTGETTDETKLKGTLEVLHVGESTTECRITNKYGQNAIAVGDIISNPAFARNQIYTFVVKGIFDMSGTGKANTDGASQVKEMITHSGGKLSDHVSVGTDFVVIGEAPTIPAKPGDDATEHDLEVYEQQMKVMKDYDDAKTEAGKYGIQILNLNRFLVLIGYQPGKVELNKLVQR